MVIACVCVCLSAWTSEGLTHFPEVQRWEGEVSLHIQGRCEWGTVHRVRLPHSPRLRYTPKTG